MTATITVSRKDLGDAMTFATLALPKRAVLPVLAGVKVTMTAGALELAAFDYDTSAAVTVHGQGTGRTEVLASGPELAVAVKSLPRGKNVTAQLDVTANSLTISCEGIEASVSLLALNEYPTLPALPAQSGVADGASFARSVLRTAACAGTDDTLPALTCVQMTSSDGGVDLAATDRYRLAVDRLHWTGPDGITALIPAATLVKYAKAADKTGKVTLHFGEDFAAFSDGTRTLITHTSKSEFPRSIRSQIREATDHDTLILADAPALRAAVERAGKLTGRGEAVGFDADGEQVTVTSHREGQAVGVQHIPALIDGEAQSYGFNAAYLASVLAGFDGPAWIGLQTKTNVTTDYKGERHYTPVQRPAVLWADGDEFRTVVMPLRRQQ